MRVEVADAWNFRWSFYTGHGLDVFPNNASTLCQNLRGRCGSLCKSCYYLIHQSLPCDTLWFFPLPNLRPAMLRYRSIPTYAKAALQHPSNVYDILSELRGLQQQTDG